MCVLLSELCTVADIKETLCYISDNFEKDREYTLPGPYFASKEYTMPDSTTLTLCSQMVQCPELMVSTPSTSRCFMCRLRHILRFSHDL